MGRPEYQLLRFISWNTAGIKFTKDKNPKLPLVLKELNAQKAHVAFLQETHIGPQNYKALENVNGWRSFFTVHNPQSRGVAIFIHNKTEFQYICHDEDYSGGYIVLFCQLYGQLYTLVNVYNHQADRSMLPRLRDYLTAINTKGVLVVGGDFNTVLDPANTHPMDEGFTRSQTDSHSRLGVFFMPTNTEAYVMNCENFKAKQRQSETGENHDPLILDIKVISPSDNKMPEVASMLTDFEYNGGLINIRTGKINGAEILSSIRSLSDSKQQPPDKIHVCDYKNNDLAMTEILKINYNIMLHSRYVPKYFTKSVFDASSQSHVFNVDYLIFTQILAKRLQRFLKSSFRSRERVAHGVRLYITVKKNQTIKMSFLKNSLSSLKSINPTPPKDFTILKSLLPKVSRSSDDYRKLRQGCPLTRPILTLALKQLENKIITSSKTKYTTFCHFRQSLLIWTDNQNMDKVLMLLKMFPKQSGIKIQKRLTPPQNK